MNILVWAAEHSVWISCVALFVVIPLKLERWLPKRIKKYLLIIDIFIVVSTPLLGILKENIDNRWKDQLNKQTEIHGGEIANLKRENKDLQKELNIKLETSKTQVDNLAEYGEVATLNFSGSKSISKNNSITSPLTGWNKNYVKDVDGKKQIRYDDEAIEYFKVLMESYPKYPFSYYCLAEAYRLRGDKQWKIYAKKAIKILEITTTLPNHAPNHDDVLVILKKMLSVTKS